MLRKYGYYNQVRDGSGFMKPEFIEKQYSFLTDTGITFTVHVHDAPVHVKAGLLNPETFGSAPLFLLSTDVPENDELSMAITHSLYDPKISTRIAPPPKKNYCFRNWGAILLDILGIEPDVYHMNGGIRYP